MDRDLKYTDALKKTVEDLIELFGETITVINKQNRAVIAQDLDKITSYAEQQMELNHKLQEQEKAFKNRLNEVFEEVDTNTEQKSLTLLLTYFNDGALKEQFRSLRDQLVAHIKEAQQAQLHLNELLLFAQEHVNDTLRAIYSFSNQSSSHYNKSGKKNQSNTSLINKTA